MQLNQHGKSGGVGGGGFAIKQLAAACVCQVTLRNEALALSQDADVRTDVIRSSKTIGDFA